MQPGLECIAFASHLWLYELATAKARKTGGRVKRRRPSDLSRDRIRAALATLEQALAENPELARRSHAVVAGRLPAPELEEQPTRSNDKQVAIRLSTALLKRAEKLAQKLATDPSHSSVYRVSRSAVLRRALLRGLEALEAEVSAEQERAAKGRGET